MSTQAQIDANRRNAQSSTGPKTQESKARSAANSTTFGLFSIHNYVRPEEQEEYNALFKSLWHRFAPADPAEDIFATEAIRFTWRLRRCARVEASLVASSSETESLPADPMCHDGTAKIQAAVDRARAQALSGLQRCMASLKALQNERILRRAVLHPKLNTPGLGLADVKLFLKGLSAWGSASPAAETPAAEQNEPNAEPAPSQEAAETKRSQSPGTPTHRPEIQTQRNAPCPCQSGLKYKRCCGGIGQTMSALAA